MSKTYEFRFVKDYALRNKSSEKYDYLAVDQPGLRIHKGDTVIVDDKRGKVSAVSGDTIVVDGVGTFHVGSFRDVIPFADGMVGTRLGLIKSSSAHFHNRLYSSGPVHPFHALVSFLARTAR